MAQGTKNINVEVVHDTWKKLKIISLHKDTTLQEVVRDILDKAVNNKKIDAIIPDTE